MPVVCNRVILELLSIPVNIIDSPGTGEERHILPICVYTDFHNKDSTICLVANSVCIPNSIHSVISCILRQMHTASCLLYLIAYTLFKSDAYCVMLINACFMYFLCQLVPICILRMDYLLTLTSYVFLILNN